MKAKIFTFVRGLKNGTPPRFQSYLKSLTLLLVMVMSVNLSAKEGDVLAEVQGTGSGYGRQTTTDSYKVGWVTIGQSGYFGINSAANNTGAKAGVNATDLPVAQAVNASATSSTSTSSNSCTGYYTFYTTTSLKNVGSIEFYYSANSGNSNATAYVVMGDAKSASGGAAYVQVPLATSSTSKQGVSLGTSGTFTFTFAETQTSAKYYGVVIATSSYKRMTGGKITIKEGASSSKTALAQVTNLSAGTPSATSATITWTGITDSELDGYKVEYKKNSETNWTVAEEKTSSTSSTLSGLTPSTTYNYRVTSVAKSTSSTKKDSDPKVGTNFTTSAPASHDIFWYANGQQFNQYNQQEGAALTIPSDPNPDTYCYGKTFVGWTANQTYSHETAAPGDLFTSKDSKTVGSTTAYYAVFAEKELSKTETEKKPTFALENYSSLPSLWTTNANEGSSYLKMEAGEYVQNMNLKAAGILADGEILSSAMSVVVSCGTFGSWSGDKKVTVKVDLLDASSNVLTTNNATFTSIGNSESSDKSAISVALPTDPTQFAGIKITVSDFVTGTTLRFKNVKLTYNVKTISYSNYTTTCAAVYEAAVATGITNGSVVISKTDDATAGAASLTGLKQGDKVYIFPTANTGYKLDAVTVNGTPITDTEGKYIYTIAEEGITVSATFAPATYQISYNLDGGAWSGEAGVATYTYGIGATLPTEDDVIKANNTFLGWFLNNEGDVPTTEIGTTETGNKSFTARWLASGAKNVTISGDDKLTYSTFKPTTVDKDAENLEIEYSIEKGFTLLTVTVHVGDKELTDGEVEFSDSKLTITPTAGFTDDVAIQFMVVKKMFTVTWMANKAKFKEEEIQEGSKVTLPAETPSDVDGDDGTYKFQGWTVDEQYSNETTAPAYITNNTIEPTGDVTYYAVYAIVTPGPVSNDYVKITATTDLVEDGQYIIASGTKALNSDVFSQYYLTATGVTISNNKITTTNAKLVWTIDDNDEGDVLFKSNDNGNYLQIIDAGSGHYNLVANSDEDGDRAYFTPSVSSGNWTLKSYTYKSYYVSYNSNYNEFTANTSASNLQLYKRQNNPDTYKNYRTRVAIIDHIAVNGTPVETKFVAGETFDATGLTIDVYYQGEDNPTNVTTGFTYDPTGALKTTDENITFTYQGKTADVAISVSNTVSKIEVTTDPTKMEYTEGEQFNPEGMVVTATYDNDAERVVTGYDYEPKGDLALSDKITISFGGQTTELGITINEATKTTVNWFVEGAPYTEGNPSTAVIPGKKITVLPTEPEACQGNQFVGWTAVDANYYNATTAPTDLFKTLADAPIIGETETSFYAVFASEAVGTYDEKVTLTSLTAPTADKFTYAFAKSSGSTSPSWNADQAKTYVKNTLTVTSKNDRIITKIEYTYNINKNDKGTAPTGATVTGNNSDNGSWDATNKTWTSSTNAATTVTLTVNGSAGNYGFTAIKVYLTGGTVLSDYSTTCLAALATPTIITAEGEYCGSVDVEITQPAGNPDGAKIMYSTDNETWNEYTAAVNITTSGTVYAKVVKDPKQTDVVSATYTVYPAYTLADAATAASATSQIACLTFIDLLVQARSLNEAFLKASDGQIVLLNKSSHGLSVGDKLVANDAHVTFVKAHDLLQLTSTEGIAAATTGNATTPEEKTITALEAADYGKLVKIMNVTYDATNKKFTDASSNEIAVDAKFFPSGIPTSWPDGGKFNVTGIVLTNSDKVVIAPRNTEDLESLATPLDAPANFAVASVNSYQASYSWTAVENNAGYTLYIYDGETEIYKSTTIGNTRTDYAPTKVLEAGHAYTAKLVALGDKVEHSDSPAAEVGFTTNPNAKLVWMVNGEQWGEPTYAVNEKVVTPEEDPESPCPANFDGFVGWYTNDIEGISTSLVGNTKVTNNSTAASEVTEKTYTFYAVFGKVTKPGTDIYTKVTEAQDNWKGEYLIGYDEENDEATSIKVFDGNLTTLDATNNYQTVSFETDGSIKATEVINGYNFIFTKSTTEGDYYIQSARGYYIANTTSDNKLSQDNAKGLDNIIEWNSDEQRVVIKSDANETYYTFLSFNSTSGQTRFRYMKSDYKNLVLYKRTKTNPQYSGYITTCPQTYTITIANNAKGLVEAATTTEILKGATVKLTATAYDGYTKTGGNWIVKNTATEEVVDGLVGNTNYLTMPDYDVTIDYNFVANRDVFVDLLHQNEKQYAEGSVAAGEYVLPELENTEEGSGCDAYYIFDGWVTEEIFSDAPAQNDDMKVNPTYAEGNTYYALWFGEGGFITTCCATPAPENLKALSTYLKATSAKLDWDNVTDATKYHIIVKQGETTLYDTDVEKSEFEITSGLTKETTYDVYVKAYAGCWSENAHIQFTTAAEIKSYSVTINAEGGTYELLADPEMEGNKIQEGAYVVIGSIAVTDPDHYFFKELTIEPEVSDLEEEDGTYSFTMPSKAITINIIFAEYPKVTWKMEGAADQTSIAVRNGDKFEVGTVKEAPADWKYKTYFPEFAGWVTSDKCDADGNVTTAEFITAATEVPADGLTVYGAVAKSGTKQYQLVTDVANLAANDELVIVGLKTSNSQYYAAGDITDNHNYLDAIEIAAPENNMITLESEDVLVFTLGGTTDAWTFKANDKYLSSTGSEANKWDGDYKTWNLANSSTANMVVMTSVQYTSGKFEFNMGSPRFRNYKGTQEGLYFYRYSSSIYDNLTINPQPDYGRTDLVVGNYGTVCVPYTVTVADRSGATFWNIETSNAPGYPNPTSVTIVQHEGDLVAGKPYIFYAEETTMSLFFSGDKYEASESVPANGLYGNLTDGTITINDSSDPNAGSEPTRGFFFVLQQKLYECGWNCTVGPNRGWVQAAAIEDETTPSPAPRRVIGNPNGTPTGIHNLNADGFKNIEGARKYFQNNHIVIVNEGRIFNAQGILIQ